MGCAPIARSARNDGRGSRGAVVAAVVAGSTIAWPGFSARSESPGRRKAAESEIGRASCRERVCQYVSISVVAVSFKKKQLEYTTRLNTHSRKNHLDTD